MINLEDLITVFEAGVDYGLLLAEQERDSEDFYDAVACVAYSRKMCAPSSIAPRRFPHSKAWRDVKGESVEIFLKIVGKLGEQRND